MGTDDIVKKIIVKWNEEPYVSARIQGLIIFLISIYCIMYIGYMTGITKSILSFMDTVSDALLVYTLGVMQAAPLENTFFPILALFLVNFRCSVSSLSKYGTHFELRNMLKLFTVAYMKATQQSKFMDFQFWFFWSLLLLNCLCRIWARRVESKSLWHNRSSELLQACMGTDLDDQSKFNPESSNENTMEGYKYLVYGESERSSRKQYCLSIDKDLSCVTTLEKIFQSGEDMKRPIRRNGVNIRDMSLAFALARQLRCRVEGATLHANIFAMNRKLLMNKLILTDANMMVLFKTLWMDVNFLGDCLHTSYPMIFSGGFRSLSVFVIMSLLKFIMAIFFVKYFSDEYMLLVKRSGQRGILVGQQLHLRQAYLQVSRVAISATMLIAEGDGLSYIISDWLKLVSACSLVNCSNRYNTTTRYLLRKMLFRKKVCNGFRASVGQYSFLKSFSYSAWKWKAMHTLSIGLVASKRDGTKLSDDVSLPQNVLAKVFQALRDNVPSDASMVLKVPPRDLESLSASDDLIERYWQSTCLPKQRCSHVILVWHIATSLCQIKFVQDQDQHLSVMKLAQERITAFLHASWSLLLKLFTSDRYLADKSLLESDLQSNYEVANCLSRYCAYLLVSKPELMPENTWLSKKAFQATVENARQVLNGQGSLQNIYDELILNSQQVTSIIPGRGGEYCNIFQQGVILAKKLINDQEDQAIRWEILATVWARLLVHIAPSSNAEAHAKYLEGHPSEFITAIWALFTHCGIEKSELWEEDAVSGISDIP